MTFVLAVLVFPLLLVALSLGVGLLVQRIAGMTIPALLLAPLGFAAIVGVTQVTTWSGTIAPATPFVLVALALAGVALSWRASAVRWRGRRSGWWWEWLAGPAAYATTAAPVLLAGRLTFPGYLLDTTGAIQLMGAQRLISHGNDFAVGGSGYGATLGAYFGTGYPSGSHSAFAGLGQLVGVDLLWLYAPYMAAMLGLAALVLAYLARRAGLARPAAALTGLVAAVPALVYAYALQGAIKEIVLLPTLMALGALILLAPRLFAAGPRGALPLAVVGAAGWGAIGLAFTPWLALGALATLMIGLDAQPGGLRGVPRRWGAVARETLPRSAVFAVALVVLALPTFASLQTSLDQATNVTSSNAAAVADPGNLLRPLLKVQAFGVWLGSSHRGDPESLVQTYLLIGVVIVAAVLGVVWLLRRRQWPLLTWVAISVLVWLVLTPRATTWTAAKLLVLLSPVVLLVACIGAFGRLGPRRLDGLLLGAAIAFGVLASDALLYHSTTLAPAHRFEQLRQLGERFAGLGPTLTPDFDEYSLYLLRDMAPDGPGNAHKIQPWRTTDGVATGYGHSYDVDALDPALVDRMAAIVVRSSPFESRPPAAFTLAYRGSEYDVWRRTAPARTPRRHLGLGTPQQPAVVPACRQVRALAAEGRRTGATRLRYATRPAAVVAIPAHTQHTALAALQPDGSIGFSGPGSVTAGLRVPVAGTYRLWVEGNAGRPLRATVDGRFAGSVEDVAGGEGSMLRYDAVPLPAGRHTVRLARGGGSLAPGDRAFTNIRTIALAPVAAQSEPVRGVPLARWRSLCGQRLDWIELP